VQGFSYRLFIFVLLLEIQLFREGGWDSINWFNPATFFLDYPQQEPGYQTPYVMVYFVFKNGLRREVVVF
jgi:hypothetical protein